MYTKDHIIAYHTLVYSEISRFLRVWVQSLMPPVVTMTLYFLVFGHFVGSRLGSIYGFTYVQYIMPGLAIMAIIMQAYNNSVFSFFVYRFHKNVEEILVAPVPNSIILLGFVTASVARGLLVGVLVIGVSMFFTRFVPHSVGFVLLSAVLSSILFALMGFANAIFAKRFDDVSIIPTFVLTPLIYLGGIFYSIEQLPPLWQKISAFNPILYIVETFRYGFLGVAHMGVAFGFGMIVVFIAILFALNMYLLNKGTGIRS